MLLQSWRRFHVAGVHDHCDAAAGRRRRENRALGRSKSRRSRRVRARRLERSAGLLLLWRGGDQPLQSGELGCCCDALV